ncbi:MFS transporter [Laceyella putida]|uniref:MFS transporter n=1 Tax=Laceyella putida TaxID=110101 RepID=A0ABW2RJZ0_9BACL
MERMNQLSKLDRSSWLLLLENGLFAVASSLSGMFVNVFLWKIKKDWTMISWFNLIHFVAAALTFILAGWMVKRVDRVVSIRLGVAILSLFYLAVWLLGKNAVTYVYLLGVVLGLGAGFFWLAYNVLYFEITERNTRDIFNGANGLFTSVAGIAAPFISGLLIRYMGQTKGYHFIFGLSLVIFLAAVVVSFLFKSRSARGNFQLVRVLSLIRKREAHWRWVSYAMIAQGLREGVFAFLIGLLVYVTTKDEFTLGSFFTVGSIVSMISYFVVGKIMKPRSRNTFILIGALMMGMAVLPFVFQISSWTMWVLGVGAALFYPFYMTPLTSTVFDVIGETKQSAALRVEYVVMRELMLNIGRVTGILLFIIWVSQMTDVSQLRWFMLMIGFAPVLTWVAIRKVPLLSGTKPAAIPSDHPR